MLLSLKGLRLVLPWCLVAGLLPGLAGAGPDAASAAGPADARGWLARIHAAANTRNYQGTMVFATGGVMSSSRLAHYCVGDQVFERIEALDGKRRQVYRHNDLVHTVWPQAGLAVVERRSPQSNLPSTTQSVEPRALDQYELRPEGRDRVAGRDAVVFLLQPRDSWRFAQRLWADQETGLMLRSDVIGPGRTVLESAAFSEVEIGVKAQPDTVLQPLRKLDGLRVLRPAQVATPLEAQGWTLNRPVAGFRLVSCVKRPVDAQAALDGTGQPEVTQAVYSDGLTHVSLFIEPRDPARHRQDLQAQFGATHSLAVRRGDHWVTAMGDVPPATLRQFVDALERRP
jgi:sigma-E factor negative regulatory protein RseB